MSQNIVVRESDVYLRIGNDWFVFDKTSQPLGEGAMGTVYLGRYLSNPSVKVAIKQVAPKYADIPSIRDRAHLEGSLMFRHRHLVEMVGYCENDSQTGPLFLVSHLVQGINLDVHVKQNLKSRANSVKLICNTIMPILDALQFLHEHHIIHLDVKPSNIMIENGSNIRLMDLGIASISNIGSQTNGMIGTPKYAAPEQAEGDSFLDATTDIYQVGVTLYELLASENPFDAPTVAGMMRLHQTVTLPYVKDVPKVIINVLRKATAPRQIDRYQNISQFRVALTQAIAKMDEPWWHSKLFPWI